jgi:hypothetical protein
VSLTALTAPINAIAAVLEKRILAGKKEVEREEDDDAHWTHVWLSFNRPSSSYIHIHRSLTLFASKSFPRGKGSDMLQSQERPR